MATSGWCETVPWAARPRCPRHPVVHAPSLSGPAVAAHGYDDQVFLRYRGFRVPRGLNRVMSTLAQRTSSVSQVHSRAALGRSVVEDHYRVHESGTLRRPLGLSPGWCARLRPLEQRDRLRHQAGVDAILDEHAVTGLVSSASATTVKAPPLARPAASPISVACTVDSCRGLEVHGDGERLGLASADRACEPTPPPPPPPQPPPPPPPPPPAPPPR